jgi:hypothetical protein
MQEAHRADIRPAYHGDGILVSTDEAGSVLLRPGTSCPACGII